eukprot:365139-Chlamydomonas_euryale.AAC.32
MRVRVCACASGTWGARACTGCERHTAGVRDTHDFKALSTTNRVPYLGLAPSVERVYAVYTVYTLYCAAVLRRYGTYGSPHGTRV